MASRRRSVFVLPAVIIGCSILGGIYGPGLTSANAAPAAQDDIKAGFSNFTKVYSLVEKNFADQVDPDKAIYDGAIPGALRTLDPHSNFFDPRAFQVLREDQRGHYYGVGMTIGPSYYGNGQTIVIQPFPGSPSYKAGIRPGDAILAVDGKSTKDMKLDEIADALKGPRGTKVVVTIGRDGSDTPLTFELVRDEIPRNTVDEAFWYKPGIAYLCIESFNENTSKEMEDQLNKLGESKIQGLILDLRGNPGGLLNEAVSVAGHFLRKGQLVVSHRGRSSPEKNYFARTGSSGQNYPIVVLVNRYSASAAEIVSGALQDHDRAWVLGENTFGKGLVQTVYPLNYDTGLALTTARYYTPSGRLIQRDYSHISFYDYYFRKETDSKNLLDAKSTDSGRTVYGGNGIAPDEKYTAPKLDAFELAVSRKYAFFNFVAHYRGTHNDKIVKGWEPDATVVEDFHKFLLDQNVPFTESEFAQDHDWVKQQLRLAMYSSTLGIDDAKRLSAETDPEVAVAAEAMPKARALLDTARKVMAERLSQSTAK
jgi:carboxyl-terminal processing protease